MNSFTPLTFAELVQRLALGIEPLDAATRQRVARPFDVAWDGIPEPLPSYRRYSPADSSDVLKRVERHDSCVYAIVQSAQLPTTITLRFQERGRRFVPRRLRYTLNDAHPTLSSPAFFPGAAYEASDRSTGLRGRVLRGGKPMRWARVEARIPPVDPANPATGSVVGRAHGDDRGEFLLLLRPEASSIGALTDPLPIEVIVYGPHDSPSPSSADVAARDPLWDLPVETVPGPAPDVITPGEGLPTDYEFTNHSRDLVSFPLGQLISNRTFTFP